MKRPCSVNTHETKNPKNKVQDMGFFDFLSANKGQQQPVLSAEERQHFIGMATDFATAYSLEMYAWRKLYSLEFTVDEVTKLLVAGYLYFLEDFTTTDTLIKGARTPLDLSEEEAQNICEMCGSTLGAIIRDARSMLEEEPEKHAQFVQKTESLSSEMLQYVTQIFPDCLQNFVAIMSILDPCYPIRNYDLCFRVVEEALTRITGEDFRKGIYPFHLTHARNSEYIQAYFYPVRVSEEEVLAFTYRIYRDLFGEAFAALASARRKMVELFTADEKVAETYRFESAEVYMQVLEDREKEVFSMGVKDREVPLSDLNIGYWDRKKIFRIPAPSVKDMENVAIQSFLDGFTGKK